MIAPLQKLTPAQLALPVCSYEPEMGDYNEAGTVEVKKMEQYDRQVYMTSGEFKFVDEIINIW